MGISYQRTTALPFWELKSCRGVPHARSAHAHHEWSLGLIEGGQCTVRCAGAIQLVSAPALIWFSPETVHSCTPARTEEWAFRMLYWRSDSPRRRWHWRSLEAGEFREMAQFLDRLAASAESDEVPDILANLGFGRQTPAAPPADGHHVPASGSGAWDGLARPDRRFKRELGLPPGQYRVLQQVLAAQELLRQGSSPLEAALACGFYDQSHLSRCFRRLTGTSPRRFQAGPGELSRSAPDTSRARAPRD